jgi:cytochrome c-type biogenesis protein CcmH/NrfG
MNATDKKPSALGFILDQARNHAFGAFLAGRWQDTEILLKGILAVDPGDSWALSVYATMLRQQRKLAAAAALIERAHEMAPADHNISAIRDHLALVIRQAAACAAPG